MYCDEQGNELDEYVNYKRLKPNMDLLCPYKDILRSEYLHVCPHCRYHPSKYSVVITGQSPSELRQTLVCNECYAKFDATPGVFPVDSEGYRIYSDIHVLTYVHSLPANTRTRPTAPPVQRLYPDIRVDNRTDTRTDNQ